MALPTLEPRRRAFAEEYLKSNNIYRSALAAGYSDNYARVKSYALLDRPDVQAYIAARRKQMARNAVTPERVLLELADIGFGEKRYAAYDMFGNEQEHYPAMGARLKALELMGKNLGLYDARNRPEEDAPDDGFADALNAQAPDVWAAGDDAEDSDNE